MIDTATLGAALCELGWGLFGPANWQPVEGENSELQRRLIDLYAPDWPFYEQPPNLKVKTSRDYILLNDFRIENGFEPCFQEIGPTGIGVATMLDLLVEWTTEARKAQIFRGTDSKFYQAFELPAAGVRIVDIKGYEHPMVQIPAQNDITVWLTMTNRPADELTLAEWVIDLLSRESTSNTRYAGVRVPTLEMNAQINLEWLSGMSQRGYSIDQVRQQFKLSMKAPTGISTNPSVRPPLEFNQPFLGFFTREDWALPIGAFYAEVDSWQAPQSSLEKP